MALQHPPDRGSAATGALAVPGPAPLLEVRGLRKEFSSGGLFGGKRSVAVEDVSFTVGRGEAVAIVGESGSGKSTIARLLVRLVGCDGGEIRLDGRDVLSAEPRSTSLAFRGRVQMIFQDPFGSLNPVHSVLHHLVRPLQRHRRAGPEGLRARALELLRTVGLTPAQDFIDRYPHELSGGQRQRVAIARALAVEPDLLVADEPTSMLDVSIRTGVLNLLNSLKRERGLGIILITHDLASARYLSDRILVLYRGRIVEEGESAALIEAPLHPYTKALLSAIADSGGSGMSVTRPRAAAGQQEQAGCAFAPRCPEVMGRCRAEEPRPRLVQVGASMSSRQVRCHLYPEVAIKAGS